MTHFLISDADPPAKQAILVQSLDLFAERGVDAVTVRDIATRTGYTNPALFRHFESKEVLAYALFERCYDRLAERFRRAVREDEPLRQLIIGCLEFIEESPDAVHYVLENLRRFFGMLPKSQRQEHILNSMRQVLEVEQRHGRLAADVDIDLAATVLLGALAQLAYMAYFDELSARPTALADGLWRVLVGGIGADAAATKTRRGGGR